MAVEFFLALTGGGHRISAAPVKDGCRISAALVRDGCRISAAPVRDRHRISAALVGDGRRISVAPVTDDQRISAAPVKEFLRHCSEMVAEFLERQSDGRRISAAPVRDGGRISAAPVTFQVLWGMYFKRIGRLTNHYCTVLHIVSFVLFFSELAKCPQESLNFIKFIIYSVKIDMKTLSKPILENHKIVWKAL